MLSLYDLLMNNKIAPDKFEQGERLKKILIEKCEWDRDVDSLTIYIQDLDDTAETVKILDLFKKVDLSIKQINLENVKTPDKNQVLTIQSIRDFLNTLTNEYPGYIEFLTSLEINKDKKTLIFNIDNIIIFEQVKKSTLSNVLIDHIKEKYHTKYDVKFQLNKSFSKENTFFDQSDESIHELAEQVSEKAKNSIERKESSERLEKIRQKSKLSMEEFRKLSQIFVRDLNSDITECLIIGKLVNMSERDLSQGVSGLNKTVVVMDIYDKTGTISCKTFIKNNELEQFHKEVKVGNYYRIAGKHQYDSYDKAMQIQIKLIEPIKSKSSSDDTKQKRTELCIHTKMSMADGLVDIEELMKRLVEWEHKAVGITDIDVVQAFPEVAEISKKYGIKVVYGLDTTLIEKKETIFIGAEDNKLYSKFVVFDIETTGLSPQYDKITEIGAAKIENGVVVDTFNQLINPEKLIPRKIESLTGITNEMVKDKPLINQVLPEFIQFCEDAVLVAHNAEFDISFILKNVNDLNLNFHPPYIDTLPMARVILTDLKRHRLDTLTKYYKITLENHHRAKDDAVATAHVFMKLLETEGIKPPFSLTKDLNQIGNQLLLTRFGGNRIKLLALNQQGIYNLYQIVTESHLNSFYGRAKVDVEFLQTHKEGLLVGSGGYGSELYNLLERGVSDKILTDQINKYDFIEIHPPVTLYWREDKELSGEIFQYERLIKRLVSLGKKCNKIIIATGNVYYLDAEDAKMREILYVGGQPRYFDDFASSLYFRNTSDMLNQFSFLGESLSKELVIYNPQKIVDMVEDVHIILPGTYSPSIPGSDDMLREMTYRKAKSIYGDVLPVEVSSRLERELTSIISNGYSVLYIIAQKLVTKSNRDGYLVGSRGSVGSSFVATMADITEVNPLSPHYICPNCKYSEFIKDGSYQSGVDMPDKLCPNCKTELKKDGHEIPFEVFLGFEGDKEPDIDLNFAGEYQSTAHKYIEEIFGKANVIRAGTIGTISDKTAFGYIKNYSEKTNKQFNSAELRRMQGILNGIKRTTGQHPGGIMIFPKEKNIYEFTPLQHPADDITADVITTHFSYKALSGHVLKLDILGHDVPSIIKMLSDLTGIDPLTIPLGDQQTMKIFEGDKDALISTLGIPEFGTEFVQNMLEETHPTTFSELVRISGLSHGTDVWVGNAKSLIEEGVASLKGVICTRDDIMTYLIHAGLEKKMSFTIMESVRKGKGLKTEHEEAMHEKEVPQWYIDSCNKIKYMFPKAHAVAYVLMSYRIAYFKVHYPEAFYATYFSTKINDFPPCVLQGKESTENKILKLKENEEMSTKEQLEYQVLEVALEMYNRGIVMENVSIEKSSANQFLVSGKGVLLPPFRALEYVSDAIASNIFDEAKKGSFLSIEDFSKRTKANKNAIESMKYSGLLNGLSETNQLSFF